MLNIHTTTDSRKALRLYHHGLLALTPKDSSDWTLDDYIQLTPETAVELADALKAWAEQETLDNEERDR